MVFFRQIFLLHNAAPTLSDRATKTSYGIFLCSRTSFVRWAYGQNRILYSRIQFGSIAGSASPGDTKQKNYHLWHSTI